MAITSPPDSSPASPDIRVLDYQRPTTLSEPPRPAGWVYAVIILYVLLLAAPVVVVVVGILAGGSSGNDRRIGLIAMGVIAILLLCELALLIIPVRVSRGRPVHRSTIWPPLLASGLLAGLLILGAGVAYEEYVTHRFEGGVPIFFAVLAWVLWCFIFGLMAVSRGPCAIGTVLHRTLVAGSILELFVAVSLHLVVRRRSECCAGFGTGFGIALGVIVMLLAFGPSLVFLYYRRARGERGIDARQ